MSNKAISPIISTILLILITVISSTTVYFWMMDIQSQVQTDTEQTISSSATSELSDFTIISVLCNATTNEINITLMNNGVGIISSGTAILALTNINGVELYTSINSNFESISQGSSAIFNATSTHDLQKSSIYIARLTLSNGKTRSRSCTAQ